MKPSNFKPPIRVCYFGTYRANYSRNQMLLKGLKTQDAALFECHATLWHGIEDRVRTAEGGWLSPRFWLRLFSAYYQLFRKHRQIPKYDVMLLGYPGVFDTFLARLLSWGRRVPLVLDHYMSLSLIAEERGLVTRSPISGAILRLIEGFGLHLPDLLLSDTDDYIEYHRQTFNLKNKRFALVPAGADDKIFYPRDELKPPSGRFRLIYYGTFIPNHGLPAVIEALALLREDKSLILDLYGEGPEKSKVETLSNELGLTNVSFCGWVSSEQLADELAKSHLSLGAFGLTKQSMITVQNKIWESMAVRRPVITGDGPAIRRELKHKESVFLVERMNPEALADGIRQLMDSDSLRDKIAENGYRRAQEHTVEALGSITVKALEKISRS